MPRKSSLAFSVIIPTLGERINLLLLVRSLLNQKYRGKVEIIVVINTRLESEVIDYLRLAYPQVRYVVQIKPGPSLARNTGVKLARYRHLIFLDDDILVGPGYLRAAAQAWAKHRDAKLMGGKIQLSKSLVKRIPSEWWRKHPSIFIKLDFGLAARPIILGENLFSAQMLYLKEPTDTESVFHPELGNYPVGFEPIGGEDYELTERVLLRGREVWYCPTIVATHTDSHAYSFKSIVRRRWQSGREIALAERLLVSITPEFYHHTFARSLKENIFYRWRRGELWQFLKTEVLDPFALAFFVRYLWVRWRLKPKRKSF